MVLILYLFSVIYNGFAGFFKKKSNFLLALTLILMIVIIGFNSETLDNVNYIRHYNNIPLGIFSSNKSEFGFVWLMQLGNRLGLTWIQFKVVISLILVPLNFVSLKKFNNNLSLVYFLYLMHAFFMDAEQFRNFIALSIFIYSFQHLVIRDKKNLFFYIVNILIATSIHNSYIFYLPLVLIRDKNKQNALKVLVGLSIIFSFLTLLNGNRFPVIDNIIQATFIENAKITKYISSQTNLGFLIPFGLHTFNYLMIYYSKKIYELYGRRGINSKQEQFINLTYLINVFLFAYFPLFIKSTTFYRLTRNLSLINFTAIAIVFGDLKDRSKYKIFLIIVVIINILIWFTYDLAIRPEQVLIPIFKGISFFNIN